MTERSGPTAEIVEFDDKLAAMQALRDGAVEGYAEDNVTLLSLAAGDPDLTLLPGGHNPVQFGIGVRENDSAWHDQVNVALACAVPRRPDGGGGSSRLRCIRPPP